MPEPTTMTATQRLVWTFSFIAIPIAMVLGAHYLFRSIERSECPSGTFLFGPLHPGTAIHFSVFSLIAFVIFGALAFIKNKQPMTAGVRIPPRSQAWGARAAFLGGLLFLGGAFWADLCQYCLLPDAIAYRVQPWEAMQRVEWSTVRGIQTACWQQKRNWDASYRLLLADGIMIDVATAPDILRNYPILAHQLHNRAIPFDARGVSPYCKSPLLPLLITPP